MSTSNDGMSHPVSTHHPDEEKGEENLDFVETSTHEQEQEDMDVIESPTPINKETVSAVPNSGTFDESVESQQSGPVVVEDVSDHFSTSIGEEADPPITEQGEYVGPEADGTSEHDQQSQQQQQQGGLDHELMEEDETIIEEDDDDVSYEEAEVMEPGDEMEVEVTENEEAVDEDDEQRGATTRGGAVDMDDYIDDDEDDDAEPHRDQLNESEENDEVANLPEMEESPSQKVKLDPEGSEQPIYEDYDYDPSQSQRDDDDRVARATTIATGTVLSQSAPPPPSQRQGESGVEAATGTYDKGETGTGPAATTVEAAKTTPVVQEERGRSFRTRGIIICLFCLAIIAVAIIIPLVVIDKDNNDREITVPTPAPGTTAAPTPTPSPIGWIQLGQPVEGSAGTGFGAASTLTSGIVVIGAPNDTATSGTVQSFTVASTGALQPLPDLSGNSSSGGQSGGAVIPGGRRRRLQTEDRQFGQALAVAGQLLLVGAPGVFANGTTTPVGAAYLYEYSDASSDWQPLLGGDPIRGLADPAAANEGFGSAVGLSDENGLIVIGAPTSNDNIHFGIGRAYVFNYDASADTVSASSENPLVGDLPGDSFGAAVSVCQDGSAFLVGAPGNGTAAGYATLYLDINGGYSEVYNATGEVAGEMLGSSVVMLSPSGDVFAVGAPGYGTGYGRVSVFELVPGTVNYAAVGADILGENDLEKIGAPGTVQGSSAGPGKEVTIVLGTFTGIVRRYDFNRDTLKWDVRYDEVSTGYSSGISSLSVASDSSIFVASSVDMNNAVVYQAMDGAPTPGSPAPAPPTEVVTAAPSPLSGTTIAPNITVAPGETMAPSSLPSVRPVVVAYLPVFEGTLEGDTGLGAAVTISENTMAAGAPLVLGQGGVATYVNNGTAWEDSTQLYGDTAGQSFGTSVDMASDGSALAVGAPFLSGGSMEGELYYYKYDGTSWTVFARVGDLGSGPDFGYAVATSTNDAVIIGAPSYSSGSLSQIGCAYVFTLGLNGVTLVKTANFTGSSDTERFGAAVDVSSDGTVMIVGAPGGAGYASIFEFDGANWSMTTQILGEDQNENMGTSVQVLSPDGSVVAAGGPGYSSGAGRVVVYEKVNGSYAQTGPPIVGDSGDRLGDKNSISGTLSYASVLVGTASGLVKRLDYNPSNTEWVQLIPTVETGKSSPAIAAGPNDDFFVVGGSGGVTIYEVGEQ